MDQDLFVNGFKLGEDRNYTMGFGISYSSSRLRGCWLTSPVRWLGQKLYARLNQGKEKIDDAPFIYSLLLGNGSFTPDDLASYAVIPNDRPYGNITYLQQTMDRVDQAQHARHTLALSIGVLGTNISRAVQTEIHTWSNENDTRPPRTPRGWPHQISNGGEPTLMLTRSSEFLLTTNAINSGQTRSRFLGEIKHGWKYSLGYYTRGEYGVNLRLGLIDPANWTYDVSPLDNSNKMVATKTYKKPEVYLLANGGPVFMLYNALLNGQFRHSDHTVDFAHMRHLFVQFNLGLAAKIPIRNTAIDLRWKILSGRTAEFELPGRDTRSHYWGGLDILVSSYR